MDPESVGKETIVKVTDWLRGIWEMRRRTGPVQQWVDSIPCSSKPTLPIAINQEGDMSDGLNTTITPSAPKDIPFPQRNYSKLPSMTVSAPINVPTTPAITTTGMPSSLPYNRLARDPSIQSDSSHCSSVESLLELRKADPEAILFGLGFGGCSGSPQEGGPLSRIPKRFLQPSKLKGIAITDFVKQQQETSESFDSVSLGYRGLTGSPYVAPSEIVQKIMERLRDHESHEMDVYTSPNCNDQPSVYQQNGRLSVLSPDNRQFLDQPRSRSPDMRNKRMIIGQKSFAFGCDGDLIEISPSDSIEDSSNSPNNYGKMNEVLNKKYQKITKQLSFDDGIELFDAHPNLTNCDKKSNSAVESEKQKMCNMSKNVTGEYQACTKHNIEHPNEKCDSSLKYFHRYRRASEGSCKLIISEKTIAEEERRFSDGSVRKIDDQNTQCRLVNKRKNLKRQSRITETDTVHCPFDLIVPKTKNEEKESESLKAADTISESEAVKKYELDESKTVNASDTACCETLPCSSKMDDIEQEGTTANQKTHPTTKNQKHYNDDDDVEPSCNADKDCKDCHCRTESTKCRQRMKKIVQENKKLETMVVKNRREMAVIRDMLNSVLSVRMEPGF